VLAAAFAASVRRCAVALGLAVAGALYAAAPATAAGALSATPSSAPAGAAITFSGVAPAALPPPYTLDFGDGAKVTFALPAFSFVHVYPRPGLYTARLTAAGAVFGTAVVTIVQPTFRPGRAPVGRIYTTTLTIPSVLAGGETALIVRFSIADATYTAAATPILAYVELRTPKDRLIRRSDPLEIIPGATTGLQSATIPYSVPVDAGGAYALRVLFRAAGGGMIATSDLLPLLVAAGPDPSPALHTEFRASGSLEVGPNAASAATFNPGALVALQWPTHQLSVGGLYDPVSHRPDPLFTLESRAPGTVQSPDAAPTAEPSPSPSPLPGAVGSFKDTLGRSSAALPALLGDGTTLRGIDASRTVGAWTLHGAYGYAQLSTPSVPAERAAILDVGRTLGAGNVRAALYQRDDDVPTSYVVTPNVPGPLRAIVAELDFKQTVVRNVTFTASAANSDATSLVQPLSVKDGAARAELAYAFGATNARLEYHNAGDGFATGAGPGATSDRAGWVSSFGFALNPKAALTFGAEREQTRSTGSRQGNATASLELTPTERTHVTFGLRRDVQSSSSTRTTSDQLSAALTTTLWGGQLSVNGSLLGLDDAFTPANAAATRTGTVQFTRQSNAHTLGVGLSATAVTGGSANAQTGQSLTYGFPVGGRVVDGALLHGFELQFALTNTTASSAAAVTADQALSAIVSYHLTKHLAAGVRAEAHHHNGAVTGPLGARSALRLRLDLTQ
jgi:hypothetical protein